MVALCLLLMSLPAYSFGDIAETELTSPLRRKGYHSAKMKDVARMGRPAPGGIAGESPVYPREYENG